MVDVKVYETRLTVVCGKNDCGEDLAEIIENDAFVGAECTFCLDESSENREPLIKVFLNVYGQPEHIGYLMPRVSKSLSTQMRKGKVLHGYVRSVEHYDESKATITAFGGDGNGETDYPTACLITVWAYGDGDDESVALEQLKKRAVYAGTLKDDSFNPQEKSVAKPAGLSDQKQIPEPPMKQLVQSKKICSVCAWVFLPISILMLVVFLPIGILISLLDLFFFLFAKATKEKIARISIK